MKTLRTLLSIITFLSAVTFSRAQSPNSILIFHHQDYLPMTVELDYVRYNVPKSEHTFQNITPGRHYLRVYGISGQYHMYNEPVFYKGYIDIPAYSTVNAVITYDRTIQFISVTPLPVYSTSCGNHGNGHGGYHGYPSGQYNYYPPAPQAPACIGMAPQRYQALKASIAARSFDSTRLMLAKQAIRNNEMSSAQIAGLAELLSFDSSRLELAKFGYTYVADPENYYQLYDLFAFDSSVRQLSDYIARFS